jgi:A/G-specific adenine glycosylase
VAVVEWAGRLLVRRRPETGLLAGLWEFPSFELEGALEPAAVVQRGLEAEHGVTARIGEPLVIVNHDFTHFSVTMHAIQAEALAAGDAEGALWVRPEDLTVLAFSSANRRIIDAL